MAYSLTVAGYEFENPPEEYRKLARLMNSPQPAFRKESTAFYQSDSQDLQFQVEGTLALDPPLGEESDDADELERLQEIAIKGGEVGVEFDPFFSGRCVIEDDPFRQAEGESTYEFTFTVNSEDTDNSEYPDHSSPDTGNTFELGDLDLGYDPSEISQNYERQTEKVKRLQGIARSVDNEGLVPKVTISGLIDGGGQAELWDKARSNVLAYLTAEFQNGWVLIDTLSIRNNPEAPDYLTGLFRYDLDLMVVMDPTSGIGEVSKYVDQNVKGTESYVSDCDDDGVFERLGNDSEDYPYALDYRVSGGTGKLKDEYLEWQEDFGTLEQSETNYIWVEDPDDDGYGNIETGTSGFPGDTVPLFEIETGESSVEETTDKRTCLTGSRLDDEATGDMNFSDNMELDDRIEIFRQVTLSDQMSVSNLVEYYRGILDLSDSIGLTDSTIDFRTIQDLQESITLDDGGSATSGTGGSITWESESDWDDSVDAAGVVSQGFGDREANQVWLGYDPDLSPVDEAEAYWTLDEDSGSTAADVTGNGHDGDISGVTLGSTGILSSTCFDFDAGGYVRVTDDPAITPGTGSFTVAAWVYFTDGEEDYESIMAKGQTSGGEFIFYKSNGELRLYVDSGEVDAGNNSDSEIPEDQWVFVTGVYDEDESEGRVYLDASETGSDGGSPDVDTSKDLTIGASDEGDGRYWPGRIDEPMYFPTDLTDSEIQALMDATASGHLETATKTFDSPVEPDLENLDYTLNGESIDLDVIGSPGSADEETHTITLDGSESYEIDWNQAHTDFRLELKLSTEDVETTPQFSSADLGGLVASDDDDQNQKTTWEILGAEYDSSGNEYEGGGVVSRYGG